MTQDERDALLIRLDEWRQYQMRWTEDHVRLHERLTLAFYSAAVSTVLALATTVFALLR
jgi:hypothetical protein